MCKAFAKVFVQDLSAGLPVHVAVVQLHRQVFGLEAASPHLLQSLMPEYTQLEPAVSIVSMHEISPDHRSWEFELHRVEHVHEDNVLLSLNDLALSIGMPNDFGNMEVVQMGCLCHYESRLARPFSSSS